MNIYVNVELILHFLWIYFLGFTSACNVLTF
jgi:hypothetical protein